MVAAAAFLAGVPAAAQTVYKLIDKNGKVTYSEEPPKHFDGQVIRIDIDPNVNKATLGNAPGERGQDGITRAKPDKESAREREQSHAERLDAAREKLDDARKALADARDNPREGDVRFVGKVGGGARPVPSEEYQNRLAGLERAVKEAEDEVKQLEGRR
jgi:hypothetical protein